MWASQSPVLPQVTGDLTQNQSVNVCSWKAFPPREQQLPLERKTGRSVLLGKNTHTHTHGRLWPVYENHKGISLITLPHKHTQDWECRGAVCVCVCEHTNPGIWDCLHDLICSECSVSDLGTFGFRLIDFPTFSVVFQYIKKLRSAAGNN